MKNRNLRKALIIIIGIIFLFTISTNFILSSNICHIRHCMIPNCSICIMIQSAIDFINLLENIVICIILLGGTIFLTHLTNNVILMLKKFSLIKYHVQHNE